MTINFHLHSQVAACATATAGAAAVDVAHNGALVFKITSTAFVGSEDFAVDLNAQKF